MMSKMIRVILGSTLCCAVECACADDLTGADRLLCASSTAVLCVDSGECASASPQELNIPQFIEVNLQQKRFSTTQASGAGRATDIDYVKRVAGQIVLQGHEMGHAFSWMISEKTGVASAAIAADRSTIAVFGACTPVASR